MPRFGSYERDNETGLDFAQARYYANAQGRFTSVDPENAGAISYDPQSWNGYTYAGNSPLIYGDPSGKTYKLCVNGQCSEHSDANVDEWRKNEGVTFRKGKILNNDGKQIGTYERTYFDNESAQFNQLVFGLAARATATKQLIGVAGVAGPLIGSGLGYAAFNSAAIGGFLLGPGLTTLNIGFRAGSTIWATGQAFERVIQTSQGPVQIYADIVVQGSKVTLKDLLVYPQNSATNLSGVFKELIRARGDLIRELKSQGFNELRIAGERVANSSSKNPGHQIDITIPLK